jgi:sodium/potassium-transporting ATPase subunit alpha
MASIAGMLPSDVDVLRDGRQMTMPAKDLVVGDLVYVTLGDKVSHFDCQIASC